MLRPFFSYVVDHFKDVKITGLEMGVKEGINAENILREIPTLEHLYLVDRWKAYNEKEAIPLEMKVGYCKQEFFDIWKKSTYEKFQNNSSITILEMDSFGAANFFKTTNIKLDFVYIDGSHAYESVMRDCIIWLPIVKIDGILGGHDFNNKYAPSVAKAAKEFSKRIGTPLQFYKEDWWIQL